MLNFKYSNPYMLIVHAKNGFNGISKQFIADDEWR